MNPVHRGWSVASLLPSLASGYSAGSTPGSRLAMAQVTSNPQSLLSALSMQKPRPVQGPNMRQQLINRILGTSMPTKNPGINPAVNYVSSRF